MAVSVFSIPACQSEPETGTDAERSPEEQGVSPVTTATSISIDEGTAFLAGDTITFRAQISPGVSGGNVVFFATTPVQSGAPVSPVVDGVAIRKIVCGSARVPFGSHAAQAQYLGDGDFLGSYSTTISYTCVESPGD